VHNLRLNFFLHQLEGGGLGHPLATPMRSDPVYLVCRS